MELEIKTLTDNVYAIREEGSDVWKMIEIKPGEEVEPYPGLILRSRTQKD